MIRTNLTSLRSGFQLIVGSLVALSGLLKILFIFKFVTIVTTVFTAYLKFEFLSITLGSLFPFIQFFLGLLVIGNVQLKSFNTVILVVLLLSGFLFYKEGMYQFAFIEWSILLMSIILFTAQFFKRFF